MFLPNKYTKWYFSIISNRQSNPPEVYSENHHIIPKSIGGSNMKDNLVNLTPKEHYICHLLLVKMCASNTHKQKMVYAMRILSGNNKHQMRYTSRSFHIFKTYWFSELRGQNHPNYGKPLSKEHKRKMSVALTGIKKSDECKHKCSISKLGNKNPNYGKIYTKEEKAIMSAKTKGRPRRQEDVLISKRNKAIIVCDIILKNYDRITDDNIADAKRKGLLGKTFPKTDKIKEVLGFIPISTPVLINE